MLKLALCVALVGCGSKDEPKPADKPVVEKPAPERPHNVDPPAVRPATPPPPPPPTDKSLGQCTFTVSGAATATATSFGGISAVSLSHWAVDPKVREMLYPKGTHGMIINCATTETSLSFTANKLTAEELPFGPKKYELKKGLATKIHVLGRMTEGSILGAEGTLEITAMDAAHVAGTFDFKSQLLKKNAGGTAPLEVKGSFDYKCPGTCK